MWATFLLTVFNISCRNDYYGPQSNNCGGSSLFMASMLQDPWKQQTEQLVAAGTLPSSELEADFTPQVSIIPVSR